MRRARAKPACRCSSARRRCASLIVLVSRSVSLLAVPAVLAALTVALAPSGVPSPAIVSQLPPRRLRSSVCRLPSLACRPAVAACVCALACTTSVARAIAVTASALPLICAVVVAPFSSRVALPLVASPWLPSCAAIGLGVRSGVGVSSSSDCIIRASCSWPHSSASAYLITHASSESGLTKIVSFESGSSHSATAISRTCPFPSTATRCIAYGESCFLLSRRPCPSIICRRWGPSKWGTCCIAYATAASMASASVTVMSTRRRSGRMSCTCKLHPSADATASFVRIRWSSSAGKHDSIIRDSRVSGLIAGALSRYLCAVTCHSVEPERIRSSALRHLSSASSCWRASPSGSKHMCAYDVPVRPSMTRATCSTWNA